jgi:pyruvate kinase
VAILVDLQGPKVRTARNPDGQPIALARGARVRLTAAGRESSRERIAIDYPGFARDVAPGSRVLLDDGKIVLRVEERDGSELVARVLRGGPLKEHAGVNVPDGTLRLRAPTPKDVRDAAFAIANGADFLALSFVQTAGDLHRLRRLVDRHGGGPAIVAKLEKPAALACLDDILAAADAVMVARGDLGVELPAAQVPIWQKRILARARAHGVPSITATQMLESMIERPVPTRAEVSDVANAILDGSGALMLSAETTIGRYPVEAMRTLRAIAREVDFGAGARQFAAPLPDHGAPAQNPRGQTRDHAQRHPQEHTQERTMDALARAATELAGEIRARRIVVFTVTGRTATILARHRPAATILALTPSEAVRRRLCLGWNTRTLFLPKARSVDELMRRALDEIRRARLARRGETLVLLGGATNVREGTHLLRLVRL